MLNNVWSLLTLHANWNRKWPVPTLHRGMTLQLQKAFSLYGRLNKFWIAVSHAEAKEIEKDNLISFKLGLKEIDRMKEKEQGEPNNWPYPEIHNHQTRHWTQHHETTPIHSFRTCRKRQAPHHGYCCFLATPALPTMTMTSLYCFSNPETINDIQIHVTVDVWYVYFVPSKTK